jgi:hypothetical protein
MTRVRFPALQYFYFLHNDQTGSGAQQAYYAMCTGGSFSEGEAAGTRSQPFTSI